MRINVHSNGGYAAGGFDSTGGEVSGPLFLNVPATEPLHATNKQYVDNSVTVHGQNTSLHLKVKDRELLDAVIVGSTEINRLNGVTSNIQDQLNSKLSLTGGTINGSLKVISSSTDPYDVVTKSTLDGAISNFSETVNSALNTKASLTGTETLTNKTIVAKSLKETKTIQGVSNVLDLSSSNLFVKTITAATVFSLTNPPANDGTVYSFVLDLTNGGNFGVTWFSGIKWSKGTAPTLTANGRDVIGFYTHDGGATWTGVISKDHK